MAVIRSNSGIAKGTLRRPAGDCSVRILGTKGGGQYFRVGHLHLAKKLFAQLPQWNTTHLFGSSP